MEPKILPTTVIGSHPKPSWLIPPGYQDDETWSVPPEHLQDAQDDATILAIREMEEAGIDVISDGEQRRENYLTYFCRKLSGFDFQRTTKKSIRAGSFEWEVPRIVGPVRRRKPMALYDLQFLKRHTAKPVRMVIPGPMTMLDSAADEYYGDEESLAMDLAAAVNEEIRAWCQEGIDVVQIDEPAFSRYPEKLNKWGWKALNRCLEGVTAKTCVHLCYSYPVAGWSKAWPHDYEEILAEVEQSKVDQLALEFQATPFPLSKLRYCGGKEVVLGVVHVGSDRVETPEEVADRLRQALQYISSEKLWVAPDCGLVLLPRELARRKLVNMVKGAGIVRREIEP